MAVGIGAAFIVACQRSGPSSIEVGFDSVRPGQSTDKDVLALLGNPAQRTVHDVAGVQVQIWQYEDDRAVYSITLGGAAFAGVSPRVIAKDMEPNTNR